MAGWHDARRDKFFESRSKRHSFYLFQAPNGKDEVLYSDRTVNVREGQAVSESVLNSLALLQPKQVAGRLTFNAGTANGCAAFEAVQLYPHLFVPEYVCIAQQRVQPASDPEASADLPLREADPDGAGQGVRIAVVDTGFADQESTRGVWGAPGVTSALSPKDIDPLFDIRRRSTLAWAAGHGTFIASLIRQVAPGAEIVPIKACSRMGWETEQSVARGIDRAVELGADIINLSWCSYALADGDGDAGTIGNEPSVLRQAVQRATESHCVLVAAAGNSASPDPMYPGAWPNVVAVAALDRDGDKWDHSNYGEWVDASARGEKLRGLYVGGQENPDNDPDGHAEVWDNDINFATWTGTSFAAPLVAAQIAVVQSAMHGDAMTAKNTLLAMSKPAKDEGCGKRIVVDLPDQA